MKIFNDYLDAIKTVMNAEKTPGEMRGLFTEQLKKGDDGKLSGSPLPSFDEFNREWGVPEQSFSQKLGEHPDFRYLKGTSKTENHYIVSVFIDVKGSTNLFRRYSPEVVQYITNTVQCVGIHACMIFGGYIQRLQGDGLFVYFGQKDLHEKEAVKRALQASSVFSYFVSNDLQNLFNEKGIENIYIRTGVDLGYKDQVVWANSGIGEVSEITTCSLHTSLPSKMQYYAESNGIVVGENVRKNISDAENLFSSVASRKGETDRYIFRNPNYAQFDFYWKKFLERQDFVAKGLDGNLSYRPKQTGSNIYTSEQVRPIAERNRPYFKG